MNFGIFPYHDTNMVMLRVKPFFDKVKSRINVPSNIFDMVGIKIIFCIANIFVKCPDMVLHTGVGMKTVSCKRYRVKHRVKRVDQHLLAINILIAALIAGIVQTTQQERYGQRTGLLGTRACKQTLTRKAIRMSWNSQVVSVLFMN